MFAHDDGTIASRSVTCRTKQDQGTQRVLRFLEKNGKCREIPVRTTPSSGCWPTWLRRGARPRRMPLFRSAMPGRFQSHDIAVRTAARVKMRQ